MPLPRMPKWMLSASFLVFAASFSVAADKAKEADDPYAPITPEKLKELKRVLASKSSHEQIKEIKVRSKDGKMNLQTLCVDREGHVFGLVAPPRGFGASDKNAVSEIHVLNADGETSATWKVDFHAQSINAGPDGLVYVAGDGKVAKFDLSGKQVASVALPHIEEMLKDKEGMTKKAAEQLKQQKESMQLSLKSIQDQQKKLLDKKEEDRTASETKLLKQYELILKSYEQSVKFYENRKVEDVVNETMGRMRIINGIAISEKDIFIVCGNPKGFGYTIWRTSKDFKDAKQIMGDVSGCCGQMDIQVSGTDVLVAENTRHRFARYDRDGKQVGAYGKKGKDYDPECFGSCCNPMNLRCGAEGEIYTAESEGIIKKFSAKGEFLGLVGSVELAGGCKNVAVGASPKGDRVYFCDLPGSRILVLGIKAK